MALQPIGHRSITSIKSQSNFVDLGFGGFGILTFWWAGLGNRILIFYLVFYAIADLWHYSLLDIDQSPQ